jgi:hypothetical protein
LYRIYHPEVFQGSLRDKHYFEGCYFKQVSSDTKNASAIIAGISLSEDSHSFIQYIDGTTGLTSYFRFGTDDFKYSTRKLELQVGQSFFTEKEIILDLENNEYHICGKIVAASLSPLPWKILQPGIMGWYSFVPGMECNHGVISTGHDIKGQITVNGNITDYSEGKGYIEKDWGISFPESWIWLQCNNFNDSDISLMISIARIPWRGSFFIGVISFFRMNGKTEVFATYNGGKVQFLRRLSSDTTEILLTRNSMSVSVVITKKGAGTLKAPSMGSMKNAIKESLNSEVELEVMKDGIVIFKGEGVRAGYEETDSIFSYF